MTPRSTPLNHVRPTARPVTRSGGSWFAKAIRWLAEADRRARERAYVRQMDDHMLRDIGITRAELDRAVRNAEPWRFL